MIWLGITPWLPQPIIFKANPHIHVQDTSKPVVHFWLDWPLANADNPSFPDVLSVRSPQIPTVPEHNTLQMDLIAHQSFLLSMSQSKLREHLMQSIISSTHCLQEIKILSHSSTTTATVPQDDVHNNRNLLVLIALVWMKRSSYSLQLQQDFYQVSISHWA